MILTNALYALVHTDQVIEFGAKIIEHYNLDYAQPFDTEDDVCSPSDHE